jgi:hypothetical protein
MRITGRAQEPWQTQDNGLAPGTIAMKKWIFSLVGAIAAAGLMLLVWRVPVLGAVVCAQCYGLQAVAPRVYLESAAGSGEKDRLLAAVTEGRIRVEAALGRMAAQPYILACSSADCDRRLGGKGAAAVADGAFAIRVSPHGIDPVILTHEFTHIAVHERFSALALHSGALPAWFDEGLAVVISEDPRYLATGREGRERCTRPPRPDLPVSVWEWGRRAGNDRDLYASAACRVLIWMLASSLNFPIGFVIDRIAAGEPFESVVRESWQE